MSIYIHIPFCTNICSYCDFCKILKNKQWIDKYLIALEKEIKENYKKEKVNTIYIGGGTPSILSLKQLEKLFNILKIFNIDKDVEITFETNTEDLSIEKINLLKQNVNRLSIGVQTFDKETLKTLNRKLDIDNLKLALKNFKNVNIDLMYGFQNQSIENLKKDLEKIIKLNPTHISTYTLIIEPHTKLYIDRYKPLNDDKERQMYDLIRKTLKENKYKQYELSNFSKKGYESRHNLTYWNNENYYGFGLGASGYVDNIRYENTRNLNEYLKGNFILNKHTLTIKEKIEDEFIVGLRKTKGINKDKFYKKYQKNIKEIEIVNKMLKEKLLLEDETNIFINPKYLYTSNEILLNFIEM